MRAIMIERRPRQRSRRGGYSCSQKGGDGAGRAGADLRV